MKAIEKFVISVSTRESRFSLYLEDKSILTKEEISGFELFVGKAKCAVCHSPPEFTDNSFHDNGLFRRRLILQTRANPDIQDRFELGFDYGRGNIESGTAHLFKFRTPSLYNIALTAPYMHDGSFRTLEEVIDFYNRGGKNREKHIEPLFLKENEKAFLIKFLKTLTDIRYDKGFKSENLSK